jgi:succinoglycan biosynthesis protein ExoA
VVSVVMPARDDAAALPAALRSVLEQDYPGRLEVVVAVGPSDDDTVAVARSIAAEEPRLVVVDNPQGGTPSGLNRAIAAATGEVIARVDAHAELQPGYLRRAVVTLRETGAVNVGGVQRAVGTTPMQRTIAAAMSSRFGTGDARFHYGGEPGPTDTVYLGVFDRPALDAAGRFDERLQRNQDYELNWRLRQAGGTVWFDPQLQVVYRPRSDLRALAVQYWHYGRWKRVVVRQHPGSLRWRQLVPPAAVAANAAGLVGAIVTPWTLVIPGTYLTGVVVAAVVAGRGEPATMLRLPAVFTTMHHAWGAGFLAGQPRASG